MDPHNPNKIFDDVEVERSPWFFESGEGSGLYLTHNGGESWTEITSDDGLPDGPVGKWG